MNRLILILIFSIPIFAFADNEDEFIPIEFSENYSNFLPLGGIYYDNVNHLNLQIGVAYEYEIFKKKSVENKNIEPSILHTHYVYSLIGKSNDSQIYDLGWGLTGYGGNARFGLSYIDLENQDGNLLGLNTTYTILFLSLKLGVYNNSTTNENQVLFGIGCGW